MYSGLQVQLILKDTKQLSRKPIQQLNVFESYNILVMLSDGEIKVFDILNFQQIASLVKAKGCNVYAVSYLPGSYLNLCAAVKKKLVIYSWDGTDFIESNEMNLPDSVKSLDYHKNTVVVCFKKAYNIINTITNVTKNIDTEKLSFITFFQDEEFLIIKNNMSFFISTDGQPNRKYSLTWSDAPINMAIQYPFAISIEMKQVEIQIVPDPKASSNKAITQPVFIKDGKSITAKKDIYISSPSSVWRLIPLPIMDLVDQLVGSHEFETAIGLLSVAPDDTPGKTEKLIKIKTNAAYHLFKKEQFQNAMDYFISAQVDPLNIISLYPGLLPPNLAEKMPFPFHIKDIERNQQALHVLEVYLIGARNKNPPYTHTPPELIGSGYDLPTLIDTTLLKVYIRLNPTLIPVLFKLKNSCHVEESQRILIEEKKIGELVLLYKSKGMHREALTLLAKNNTAQDTIFYLCQLGKRHISIILDHSKWVLQKCPKEALAIFTTERKDDPLQPDQIIPHIQQYASPYLLDYLEHIIHDPINPDKTPDFHNTLIFEYLAKIQPLLNDPLAPRDPSSVVAGSEPGLLGQLRVKLIEFLKTSKFYLPEKMLSRFPFNDLYEERAILLSKIGRHEQALSIYAHKLKNFAMAEEYCDKNYNRDSEEARDVYLSLLNVYLKQENSTPLIEPALKLLNKHYKSINTPKALSLLPLNIPIDELYPFFESVIRDNTKTKRDNQIIKNIFKAEHIKIKEELIHLRAGVIKITDELNCPVCGKKFLGTQAFAAQPNGTAVHYSCFKQDKQMNGYYN
eukprot:gene5017-6246_t